MGIVPSIAAAWRGASGAGVVTVIVQPPVFSVADQFCQSKAYEPERAITSQSTFVARPWGVDDIGLLPGCGNAMDRVEAQDD
jgi:hypothetical protein